LKIKIRNSYKSSEAEEHYWLMFVNSAYGKFWVFFVLYNLQLQILPSLHFLCHCVSGGVYCTNTMTSRLGPICFLAGWHKRPLNQLCVGVVTLCVFESFVG